MPPAHACSWLSSPRPLVFGHRGARGLAPENTLAAFDRGVAEGVDGLELDLRLSRDGVAVVIHDDDLDRTTGVAGPVSATDRGGTGARGHRVPLRAGTRPPVAWQGARRADAPRGAGAVPGAAAHRGDEDQQRGARPGDGPRNRARGCGGSRLPRLVRNRRDVGGPPCGAATGDQRLPGGGGVGAVSISDSHSAGQHPLPGVHRSRAAQRLDDRLAKVRARRGTRRLRRARLDGERAGTRRAAAGMGRLGIPDRPSRHHGSGRAVAGARALRRFHSIMVQVALAPGPLAPQTARQPGKTSLRPGRSLSESARRFPDVTTPPRVPAPSARFSCDLIGLLARSALQGGLSPAVRPERVAPRRRLGRP